MKAVRIVLWIAVALLAGAALTVFFSMRGAQERVVASDGPYGAPFELTDQNGETITRDALKGEPSAVFFGFTHCPQVCPTTLYELSGYQKQIAAEGGKPFRIVFVTVDPERDTPKVLKDYVGALSDDAVAITGEPGKVAAMYRSWGVFAKKVGEGSDYTMNHTATTFLIGPNGEFEGTIAYDEDPKTAKAKLERLVGS